MNSKHLMVVAFIALIVGCSAKETEKMPNDTQLVKEHDRRLAKGLEVAILTARKLDYGVEQSEISFSMTDDICTVHFAPMDTPDEIVMGGDLTVRVDVESNKLLDYEFGQ
jgi:hypothetical protein